MFQNSVIFLLLSVICCTLFLPAQYVSGEIIETPAAKKNIELFTNKKIDNFIYPNGTENSGNDVSITLKNFYSPFLVATDNVMVALVGTNKTDTLKENINILTMSIKTAGDEWFKETTLKDTQNSWTTQFAVNDVWRNENDLKIFLAAADNNNVYILLVNNSALETSEDGNTILKWDYKFSVRTVDSATESLTQLKWENKMLSKKDNDNEFKKQLKDLTLITTPTDGFVFSIKEKGIVFVLLFNLENNQKTKAFAFIYFGKSETTVKLAKVDLPDNQCLFKLFLWKNKIMMAKYCENDKNMQEFEESKNMWSNTAEPISGLLYYLKNKNNFKTIFINNQDVLLFTEQTENSKCTEGDKSFCIKLWMTDGSRLYSVGSIVTSGKEIYFGDLLHTKDKMFLLHYEKKQPTKILLTPLQNELENIKTLSKAWTATNEKIKGFCKNSNYLQTLCVTDGLTGFLSNIIDTNQWKNEYLNINATIHKNVKTNVNAGVTFSETGAGARWPVGEQNEKQPYNFADSGFTLVAIVTVHDTKENDYNSILGVTFAENKKTVGLWCGSNEKWVVGDEKKPTQITPTDGNCKNGNTYYILLILQQSGEFTIYIDEKKLHTLQTKITATEKKENILHFYFGADEEQNEVETHVTIKNVLLYNYPFNQNKIDSFKVNKQEIITSDARKENSEKNIARQQSSGNSGNSELNEETIRDGENDELTSATITEEVVPSSTQQRENAVGNNVNMVNFNIVVCSVLYLLL